MENKKERIIKRRLSFFLLPEDEKLFSKSLLTQFSDVRFIDRDKWSPSLTNANPSIDRCDSHWVYLWFSNIPSGPTNRTQGEESVMESSFALIFERSIFDSSKSVLMSGTLLIGVDLSMYYDETPLAIAKQVSRLLRKQNAIFLNVISHYDRSIFRDNVKSHVVGKDVLRWCSENPEGILKDRGSLTYYWPQI